MSRDSPPPDPLRRDPAELPDRRRLAVFVVEGPRVRVVVLSPCITVVFVHWSGYRTQPCTLAGPGTHCDGCSAGHPLLRQFWVQVHDLARDPWVPQPCCLTAPALESDPMLWETDGRLDGRILSLWRWPAHRKGRMFARLEQDAHAAAWPAVEDTLDVLKRMWGGKVRQGRRHDQGEADRGTHPGVGQDDEG